MKGIGYGAKNFGLGVDFAEQFMNTDDPVPTTNDPLPNCAVIDVTNCKERENFVVPEVSEPLFLAISSLVGWSV